MLKSGSCIRTNLKVIDGDSIIFQCEGDWPFKIKWINRIGFEPKYKVVARQPGGTRIGFVK